MDVRAATVHRKAPYVRGSALVPPWRRPRTTSVGRFGEMSVHHIRSASGREPAGRSAVPGGAAETPDEAPGTSSAPLPDERTVLTRPSSRHELGRIGRLLTSDAVAARPIPSRALAIAALAVYALVVIGAGGLVGVGLASIPLFVAAALLQTRGALLTALATFAVTIIPSLIPTSARKPGAPVPSTTRPLRIT